MGQEQNPDIFPRDKDKLLKEFDLGMRLRDIRETARLKDRLAPKWWEAGVGVFQFVAALGLLISIVQHPSLRSEPLLRLIAFWTTLLVLSLVFGFEFVIFRLHHLRRAYDINVRLLEELLRRVDRLEKSSQALMNPPKND